MSIPPVRPPRRARRWWMILALVVVGGGLSSSIAMARWLHARGLSPIEFAAELRADGTPRREWRSVDRKHWQVVASTLAEPAEVTDAREGTSAGCPAGMVRVKGGFRSEARGGTVTGEIERLQDAACTDWISREFPARCRTYDREKMAELLAKFSVEPMDYCIDRFEFPNEFGQNPLIVATFREAEAMCKKASKRLCTENEWTFACEGEETHPYPYGFARDATACVMDRPWRAFSEGALWPRDGAKARDELDRLWQGEPSGSREGCRSPFGVYDMTGNVDEWTRSANTKGFASILKGGYWGPVRARCRPSTRAHGEDFVAYQQSFRCCAEADESVAASSPPTRGVSGSSETTGQLDVIDDAGAETSTSSDAGEARADDVPADSVEEDSELESGWLSTDDDEIAAIARARSASCAVHRGSMPRTISGVTLALVVLAASVSRRRASPR